MVGTQAINTKTAPDQKVLITHHRVYVFFTETDKFDSKVIKVRDPQVYELMDFEFIQKLKESKNAFILKCYNKQMADGDMVELKFQTSTDEQFFIMTHLLER
jgi:hypothetical protein